MYDEEIEPLFSDVRWEKFHLPIIREQSQPLRFMRRKKFRARGRSRSPKPKWRNPGKSKSRAYAAVFNAVKKAKIIKPEACSKCGKICKLHGHHSNYDDKLNVVWLCPKCHFIEHRNIKETPCTH